MCIKHQSTIWNRIAWSPMVSSSNTNTLAAIQPTPTLNDRIDFAYHGRPMEKGAYEDERIGNSIRGRTYCLGDRMTVAFVGSATVNRTKVQNLRAPRAHDTITDHSSHYLYKH